MKLRRSWVISALQWQYAYSPGVFVRIHANDLGERIAQDIVQERPAVADDEVVVIEVVVRTEKVK